MSPFSIPCSEIFCPTVSEEEKQVDTRIDFSWTWKEKRKKAKDVLIRDRMRLAFEGCKKRSKLDGREAWSEV
jgi:hypothetical protein